MKYLILILFLSSSMGCSTVGTILGGAGDGLSHAQDNVANCVDMGNGYYSCTNQGRTYNCHRWNNQITCN